MNFKEIAITSLLVGLVAVAMITFSFNLGTDNGANVTVMQDTRVSSALSSMEVKLNDSQSQANDRRKALESESNNPPSALSGLGFYLNSILQAGNVFIGVGIGMFNVIFTLAEESLGISPIVLGTLSAILIITLVLAAWRLYRAGE